MGGGTVMTPMCNIDTGRMIGWAIASINCAGTSVTIQYYSTSGSLIGTSKPENWEYCRPGFSSDTIYSIVTLTQSEYDLLDPPDPNVLYIVVPD